MSVFESTVTIYRPVSQLYNFLADMNNHKQLMPDHITGWSSTVDEAAFDIENITHLSLKISERVPNSQIMIIAAGGPPFEIELIWTLLVTAGAVQVNFTITAHLNMIMKMLASPPLQKLAESETRQLAQVFA